MEKIKTTKGKIKGMSKKHQWGLVSYGVWEKDGQLHF